MLDKLIANLKQSLPAPLKKMMGVEENTHDEDSDHSEEHNGESHDSSDNDGDAPPEDKKKNQTSMIIRVVVVLGLGYLALTEFVIKPDPATEIGNSSAKAKKSRKKNIPGVVDTKTTGTKPTDTKPAEEKAPAKKEAEVVRPVEETKAPVENVNIADKKIEEPVEVVPEKTPTPIDNTPIVKAPTEEPKTQVGQVKETENLIDKNIDSLIDTVDNKAGEETPKKKEATLEDKIVADDVYTPPPVYDQLGRGLVYNCKEKYWVCIDKTAYVTCNKNMKWNKSHGKPAECAVANVYNSDDDCGVVQKYNVSTNKPTPFCQ